MKTICNNIFYKPEYRWFLPINNFYAALTLVSIVAIILETIPSLDVYGDIFLWIEYVSIALFSIEYLGRLLGAEKASRYAFSFFGIIDLVSVLPALFGLGSLTALKSARVLRIVRLLRTMRLLKVASYDDDTEHNAKKVTLLNFEIYFISLVSAVIISASLMYVVEPQNPLFQTIPLGMLWSVKVILGSLGAESPASLTGQLIMIGSRFVGLALFGLLITVVGTTIKRIIFGSSHKGFE